MTWLKGSNPISEDAHTYKVSWILYHELAIIYSLFINNKLSLYLYNLLRVVGSLTSSSSVGESLSIHLSRGGPVGSSQVHLLEFDRTHVLSHTSNTFYQNKSSDLWLHFFSQSEDVLLLWKGSWWVIVSFGYMVCLVVEVYGTSASINSSGQRRPRKGT